LLGRAILPEDADALVPVVGHDGRKARQLARRQRRQERFKTEAAETDDGEADALRRRQRRQVGSGATFARGDERETGFGFVLSGNARVGHVTSFGWSCARPTAIHRAGFLSRSGAAAGYREAKCDGGI